MTNDLQWAIIGAGPAGIAAVGKLLEAGQDPKSIVWIDPAFQVGDLGDKWQSVPSNTKVKLFLRYLNFCRSFKFDQIPKEYSMSNLPPEEACLLGEVVKPLQWVTDQLMAQVTVKKSTVKHLALHDCVWHLTFGDHMLKAKNVVLATGSVASHLTYPGVDMISLPTALDPKKLARVVGPEDRVAVFGSSHSAVLVLKNLCELSVKKIDNFYRSPLKYAVYMDDWVLFDNTGLKGMAASWARENLDGVQPANLSRHISNPENIQQYLSQCNKVIYTVGFAPRKIDVKGVELSQYNDKYGIIAPGLFGIGIAFPEGCFDPFHDFEYSVGLWKFMNYLDRVLPTWMKYSC